MFWEEAAAEEIEEEAEESGKLTLNPGFFGAQ